MLFPFGMCGAPPRTAGAFKQYIEGAAEPQSSPFSFTSTLPLGTKNRYVIVTLAGNKVAPANVTFTVTVGGIPCPQIFVGGPNAGFGVLVFQSVAPVTAANPQVVISFAPTSYSTGAWRIGLFQLGGQGKFIEGKTFTTGSPAAQTIQVKNGGFLVGACITANDSVGCTWTGLIERWDTGFNGTGSNPDSGASYPAVADEAARSVRWTFASSGGWAGAGAICSFY